MVSMANAAGWVTAQVGETPLFSGPPGSVKTEVAKAFVKWAGRRAFCLIGSIIDAPDVGGYPGVVEVNGRRHCEMMPLDWAMTQNNLGNALAILGERESGTERLEQAVTAYRAALEE